MKITKMSLLISGLAAVWLGLSGQVPAAVPDVMSCQGTLYTEGDSGLMPLANDAIRVKVDILPYKGAGDDNVLWSEEHLLQTDENGNYELTVGRIASSNASLADALAYVGGAGGWIKLTVLDASHVRPFQPMHLLSVPHAFAAARADQVLEGLTVHGDLTVHGTATLNSISMKSTSGFLKLGESSADHYEVAKVTDVTSLRSATEGTSIRVSNAILNTDAGFSGGLRILGMDRQGLTTKQTNNWYQLNTDCFLWVRCPRTTFSKNYPIYVLVGSSPVVTNKTPNEIMESTDIIERFEVYPGDQYPIPLPMYTYFMATYYVESNRMQACEYDAANNAVVGAECYQGSRLVPLGRVQ